jgi:hypothetical protein
MNEDGNRESLMCYVLLCVMYVFVVEGQVTRLKRKSNLPAFY